MSWCQVSKLADRNRQGWFDMLDGSLLFIQTWDEDKEIAYGLGQSEYVDTGERAHQLIEGKTQEVVIRKAKPTFVEVPYDLIGARVK